MTGALSWEYVISACISSDASGWVDGTTCLAIACTFHIRVLSRQHFLRERTLAWLSSHYPNIFSHVRFGNHYGDGHKQTKREMCMEEGAIALIDDSIKYALDVSPVVKKVILFGEYACKLRISHD